MKLTVPILWPTQQTPAQKPGLQLVCSGKHGEPGTWLHGSLSMPAGGESACAQWLQQIFILCNGSEHDTVQLGALIRQPGFLQPPSWKEKRAVFSLHTSALFSSPVPPEKILVHALAGELLTPVVLSVPGEAPASASAARKTTGDLLFEAYDAAIRKSFASAVSSFETAFKAPGILEELDAAHRYNAACAAALAAASLRDNKRSSEQEKLRGFEQQASRWLTDDLRARATLHREASTAWAASAAPEAEQAASDALYREHLRHLLADPDLRGLDLKALLKAEL